MKIQKSEANAQQERPCVQMTEITQKWNEQLSINTKQSDLYQWLKLRQIEVLHEFLIKHGASNVDDLTLVDDDIISNYLFLLF